MNVQVHDFPKKPEDPQPKPARKRMVSLTGRAPVTIIEDEWPVIAESGCGSEDNGAPWGWEIHFKVRKYKCAEGKKLSEFDIGTIIHATYSQYDETEEERGISAGNQSVRVGRLLNEGKCCQVNSYNEPLHPHINQCVGDIWKHIIAVGEELRERILDQDKKKYVTLVVDKVLADLDPYDDL